MTLGNSTQHFSSICWKQNPTLAGSTSSITRGQVPSCLKIWGLGVWLCSFKDITEGYLLWQSSSPGSVSGEAIYQCKRLLLSLIKACQNYEPLLSLLFLPLCGRRVRLNFFFVWFFPRWLMQIFSIPNVISVRAKPRSGALTRTWLPSSVVFKKHISNVFIMPLLQLSTPCERSPMKHVYERRNALRVFIGLPSPPVGRKHYQAWAMGYITLKNMGNAELFTLSRI